MTNTSTCMWICTCIYMYIHIHSYIHVFYLPELIRNPWPNDDSISCWIPLALCKMFLALLSSMLGNVELRDLDREEKLWNDPAAIEVSNMEGLIHALFTCSRGLIWTLFSMVGQINNGDASCRTDELKFRAILWMLWGRWRPASISFLRCVIKMTTKNKKNMILKDAERL